MSQRTAREQFNRDDLRNMRTLFFSEIEKSQTMKLLINVKIKINKKSLKHCI